jgi:hypothetical protein
MLAGYAWAKIAAEDRIREAEAELSIDASPLKEAYA